MATILFCVYPLQNELNSTFKLAKTLKSLGHKVLYLGLPDSEEKIHTQGFSFLPILEKWFPKESLQQRNLNSLNFSGFRLLLNKIRTKKYMESLIDSLQKGENQKIDNVLKETHCDLLLICTAAPFYATFMALIAYQCQVSTIYLTDMFTVLPQAKNIIQQNHNINNFQKTWYKFYRNILNKCQSEYWIQVMKKFVDMLISIDLDNKDIIRKSAINRKIPLKLFDFSQVIPFKLSHLFLCPEELDFPDSSREECYYAEASIDLQRQEPSFPWSKLTKDKALIYCTLGTTSETFETLGINKVKDFFQTVIDAVSLKKEYQLVVSVGDYINVEDFNYISEKTIIINRAPQLALLEQASLAIINGGIRTVKECIFWGVPMIIFPIFLDQPANAERVEYHKLGVAADIKNISHSLIIDSIEKIENDFSLKEQVETFKNKFIEIENSDNATKFILEFLEKGKCTSENV